MAGDTLEIKFIHPDVGSKIFAVKAGEDITQDLGGYTSELMVNGNLTGHKSMSAKAWELSGVSLEADAGDGSLEFLQDISDSPKLSTIVWSHINGSVYKGQGTVTGDLKAGTKEGYVQVTIQGLSLIHI